MQEYWVIVSKEKTEWFQNKMLHREDGPAIEWNDGTKVWYKNGLRHREDGPAYETKNGIQSWWWDGQRHRLDGPALIYKNGCKEWYKNGKLHRTDGPAIDFKDTGCTDLKDHWFLEDVEYSEAGFNEAMNPKSPCNLDGEIMEIYGVKYKLTAV